MGSVTVYGALRTMAWCSVELALRERGLALGLVGAVAAGLA